MLENREFSPLGSRKIVRTNARFIAATNQKLELMVKAQKLRGDLLFRLNVARIYLLPLTERKEDIPDLLQFFLNQYNDGNGLCIKGFTPDLMKCLVQYKWPGNVRELRNLVEAIFIDPPCGLISFQNLPDSFVGIFGRDIHSASDERERIISALHETGWNRTKAAGLLKVSRMTLYRKMSKLNIKYVHRSAA